MDNASSTMRAPWRARSVILASNMDVDDSSAGAPSVVRDMQETEVVENHEDDNVEKAKAKTSGRKDRDASSAYQREVGRSVFPITRVQKILKADKVVTCTLSNCNVRFTVQ